MHSAYIDYIDSNGVLIRNNAQPIVGANAIDYIIHQDDANITFSRKPQHAEVSQSGELGFTYGIYAKKYHSADTVLYGSYSTVWKKQSDGKWKLLLDTENEGVGE
jgi:ketosteroid isomerase-like protein